jgi:hypothetical protein
MSIDFMVFDPASAPRDHRDFRSWYYEQTDWPDDYDPDPSVTTPGIQSWYRQMVSHFPDANVPGVDSQAIDERYGDYNFGKHICYVAFRPNVANEAWARVRSFAADHGLGTYDPNSDDERSGDSIRFPDDPDRADVPERGAIRGFFGRKR